MAPHVRQALAALGVVVAVVVAAELGRRLIEHYGADLEAAAMHRAEQVRAAFDHEREVAKALPYVDYEAWCAVRGLEP